jgi:hypothetical protein
MTEQRQMRSQESRRQLDRRCAASDRAAAAGEDWRAFVPLRLSALNRSS